MQGNKLDGIGADISFYPKLHILLLGNNSFRPQNIYFNISRARLLTQLAMQNNNLTGTIPSRLSYNTLLTTLDLGGNHLSVGGVG